jgi:hypothetical protein
VIDHRKARLATAELGQWLSGLNTVAARDERGVSGDIELRTGLCAPAKLPVQLDLET